MSNLKELQFKTKLALPNTLSFVDNDTDDCRGTIEMKAGTATIYHDEENDKKITVPIWGYALEGQAATYPGPTIEVNSQQRVEIDWKNIIGIDACGHNQQVTQPVEAITVDGVAENDTTTPQPQNILGVPSDAQATMGAKGKAYVTPHQHGGKTAPKYDGGPLDMLAVGQSHLHRYENNQRAAMLWYHDHAMHTTRLNAFAGLAGLYMVRNKEEACLNLPQGEYELPLVIQDRNLTDADKIDALIDDPSVDRAEVNLLHKVVNGGPLEFFGPLNLVNGTLWPVKEVEGACYRVRILNGANSRSYNLVFVEKHNGDYVPCDKIIIKQIGSDGGLIPSKNNQLIDISAEKGLTLAPAERADLLIDFSDVTGKKIYMLNTAISPFAGTSIALDALIPTNPVTDANLNPYPEVMCFDVRAECSILGHDMDYADLARRMAVLPSYDQEVPHLEDVVKTRTIAVVEKVEGDGAVLVLWELMPVSEIAQHRNHPILVTQREVIIDNEHFVAVAERFHDPVSIIIPEGSTERWRFINLTADTHPMHIHLVQYLPIARRNILTVNYRPIDDDEKGDQILGLTEHSIKCNLPIPITVEAMTDTNMNLDANEQCLKDTMRVNPGEMIELIARFEEHCGRYVYHCHLLEHEDHDMMRQFIVTRNDLMNDHMFPISVSDKASPVDPECLVK